jgi:acyl-CoA synthetase (NDP forming)
VEDRVRRLLRPRSIAIVGATERPGYADRILGNLIDGGYPGRILPVSTSRPEVRGLPAAPSVAALEGPVDVAIVVVPAPVVPDVVAECGANDVGAVVVISSGFGEAGEEGRGHAKRLREAGAGQLVIGPNGNGYASVLAQAWPTSYSDLNPDIRPPVLPAALLSQSGGVAFGAGLGRALDHGYSFSAVFSMGNEEVTTSERLADLLLRDGIRVVALVAEEFRDPEALLHAARTAREVGGSIVALKVGRSEAGRRAAATHTEALAGDDAVAEGVLRQHGIVRVEDVDQLVQATRYLAVAGPPRGRHAIVVSHSGGLGAQAADALGAQGFDLPPLTPATVARLDELLGSTGGRGNPLDITMRLREPVAAEVVTTLLAEGPDLLQVITAGDGDLPERIGAGIEAAGPGAAPTHLVWASGIRTARDPGRLERSPVAWFSGPVLAAQVMARCREAAGDLVPVVPSRRGARPGRIATPDEISAKRILAGIGVPVPESAMANGVEALRAATDRVPGPWVLKVAAEGILHKAAEGLLALGLHDVDAVIAAAGRLEPLRRRRPGGLFLLEHQHRIEQEFYLGMIDDHHFGPVVGFGAGGSRVEEAARVTWATCPLDVAGALRMFDAPEVRGLTAGLDEATRGRLAEVVATVSTWFAASADRAAAIEVNPLAVVAGEERVVALDAVLQVPAIVCAGE